MGIEQLNKLQIKAEILTVISKLQTMSGGSNIDDMLGFLIAQEDKKAILDILLKELTKTTEQKAALICYLLVKLCDKTELENALWDILKKTSVDDVIKSITLNLLKDMGNKVDYEKFSEYFENPEDVIDADTQKLLHVAIVNPEAQIDFLDFLKSLSAEDKRVLVESLGEDYSSDDLANILAPLFLYSPTSELGKVAIGILGTTKSQLALHALYQALDFVKDEETIALIKKNISALKISGVREDNSIDFYKSILAASKPYQTYTSYPDGHGNQALIFSRERENESIQIVAIVVNDCWGIIDCFGFNEISKPEFERIVNRFYNGDEHIYINPPVLKSMLKKAEDLTRKTEGEISYEYICWKTLLYDIPSEPVPVEFILDTKCEKKPLSDEDLEKVYAFDFIQRWFLDTYYNQGFKILVDNLNKKMSQDGAQIDFEAVVKENSDDIFSDEEKNLLDKRILMSAYLKYLSGDNQKTQILYSLYFDEKQKSKLVENIIRKSIYEYYVALKFKQKEESKTKNIFTMKNKAKTHDLTAKQLDEAIAVIESMWVHE